MTVKACRDCEHPVSPSADFCPSCGATRPTSKPLAERPRARLSTVDVALGVFFGQLLFGAVGYVVWQSLLSGTL